jgi:hypothetical protein
MAVFEITVKSRPIEALKSNQQAPGVFDWSELNQIELSTTEISKIKQKHQGYTANLIRAVRVKRLMLEGYSLNDIIKILKHNGRGYGERMLKKDHAALTESKSPIGRGVPCK